MKYLKKQLILLLISIPLLGVSQVKRITLIIDSINSNIKVDNVTAYYSYGILYGLPLMKESTDKEIKEISENISRFQGKIEINSDTAILQIPIDNNNGYLEITSFSSLKNGDTLRIKYLKMFESEIRDTVFTVVKYFKSYGDSTSSKAYKIKKIKEIDKRKKIKNPAPMYFTMKINENEYTILVEKIKSIDNPIKTFNGQKPTNSKTPSVRFYGTSQKTNWKYVAHLKLKT